MKEIYKSVHPRARNVFGYLKLFDGTEFDLQGEYLEDIKKEINGRSIKTFRLHMNDNAENICVTHPTQVFNKLKDVQKLFMSERQKTVAAIDKVTKLCDAAIRASGGTPKKQTAKEFLKDQLQPIPARRDIKRDKK